MTPDAPWRVYLPEWVSVWTSDAIGPEGRAECMRYWRDKYRGRVRDEDWRVIPAIFGAVRESYRPYCLQLYVPNLQGEFKDESTARWLAGELRDAEPGEDPQVVQRDSPEEQALLDYSRKMLPATVVDRGKG